MQRILKDVLSHTKTDLPVIVLRLGYFVDDCEVLNAASKKSGIHKETGYYGFLLNLGPLSSTRDILPIAICNSLDHKKYGTNRILKNFFKDLQSIKNGRKIILHGKTFLLKIQFFGVTGDTLGVHEEFALKSPAALVFCRGCLIRRPMFNQNLNALAPFRSLQGYFEVVDRYEKASTKEKEDILKSWGLLSTVLQTLFTFDSLYDPFTQNIWDLFHEAFEGVSKFVSNNTFRFVIQHSSLTLSELNNRIRKFNFGVRRLFYWLLRYVSY